MNRNPLARVAGLLLVSACADGGSLATAPVTAPPLQLQVNASSTPLFAFLAPLGDADPPAGVFDALAAPVAQVCSYAGAAWSEADCATPLQEWTVAGKGQQRLAIVGESYETQWRTKANQNQSLTYRIRVLVGAVEVGFLDAGFDPAKAGPDYYVLSRRETLPIRFWVGAADEPEPEPDASFTRSPNAAIPDGGVVHDFEGLALSGCSAIQGIKVRLDIAHPLSSDLIVELNLTSLTGSTTVRLHNRTGASADIIGTYPDNLTPAQSLDAFHGHDADGRWTLTVVDQVAGNTGTLREWGVDLMCGSQ